MPMEYVVCDAVDVDSSGACTHVQYVQAPMLIPPLSAADGAGIAAAILGVWALAWVWRNLG